MKKIVFAKLFLLVCFVACSSQNNTNKSDWKKFNLEDAGIKISLPCEPSKSVKVFQEKPKLAQRYTFDCKQDNLEISVSLAEHFGDFDEVKAKENMGFTEKMLKEGIGDKADFSSKDLTFQGFLAKEFIAKNSSRLSHLLNVQNKRGMYNFQLISTKKTNQSGKSFNNEFDKNSKEFFDSIQIIEK